MEDSFLYAQMCKWVLYSERQTDLKDGAVFGTFGNLYGSAVQGSDFMHKGETESDAAERAAAGFVYAEEWFKDTFTKFLTDAGPVSETVMTASFPRFAAVMVTLPFSQL